MAMNHDFVINEAASTFDRPFTISDVLEKIMRSGRKNVPTKTKIMSTLIRNKQFQAVGKSPCMLTTGVMRYYTLYERV